VTNRYNKKLGPVQGAHSYSPWLAQPSGTISSGNTEAPDGRFLVRMARGCCSDCSESIQRMSRNSPTSSWHNATLSVFSTDLRQRSMLRNDGEDFYGTTYLLRGFQREWSRFETRRDSERTVFWRRLLWRSRVYQETCLVNYPSESHPKVHNLITTLKVRSSQSAVAREIHVGIFRVAAR